MIDLEYKVTICDKDPEAIAEAEHEEIERMTGNRIHKSDELFLVREDRNGFSLAYGEKFKGRGPVDESLDGLGNIRVQRIF